MVCVILQQEVLIIVQYLIRYTDTKFTKGMTVTNPYTVTKRFRNLDETRVSIDK